MAAITVLEQVMDLANRVLGVTAGVDVPRGNHWPTVVTVFLSQSNARLDSIRILLNSDQWDSGTILTRSLFELAVNLCYISRDIDARLPEYLTHGGIPNTSEDAEKLMDELAAAGPPQVKDVIPVQAWKPLRDMCAALEPIWLMEYETFYRFASVPTHAGSFTLGQNFIELLENRTPSDNTKATVMITALGFHIRVAKIAANMFPNQIKAKEVEELNRDCGKLSQLLAENQG